MFQVKVVVCGEEQHQNGAFFIAHPHYSESGALRRELLLCTKGLMKGVPEPFWMLPSLADKRCASGALGKPAVQVCGQLRPSPCWGGESFIRGGRPVLERR